MSSPYFKCKPKAVVTAKLFESGDEDGFSEVSPGVRGRPYVNDPSDANPDRRHYGEFGSYYLVWTELGDKDIFSIVPKSDFARDYVLSTDSESVEGIVGEFCKTCGAKNPNALKDADFCKRCGAQLTDGKCPYEACKQDRVISSPSVK